MSERHMFVLNHLDVLEREYGSHPALEIIRAFVLADLRDRDRIEVDRLVREISKRPWWRFW